MLSRQENSHSFRYREVEPPEELRHLAFCFFEFAVKGAGNASLPFEVVPDGFVSLIFKKNASVQTGTPLVRGLSLKIFPTEIAMGDRHWGVRIAPAANRLLLGCDPAIVPTMPLSGPNPIPSLAKMLEKEFPRVKSLRQASGALVKVLSGLRIETKDIDEAVASAVGEIISERGDIQIERLAVSTNIGRRQLERRFRKEVGVTPKQYSRLFRLRSTAISLIEEERLDWANRAAEMGFADQSHLIKEFVALTGRTPKRFSSKIGQTSYGKLVR